MRSETAHAPAWASGDPQGVGLGLRSPHIAEILADRPEVPWFEILTENHLAEGGVIPRQLEAIRAVYPVTFHCVGMSLGGTEPFDTGYLRSVRRLVCEFQPAWVSDHLSFTRSGAFNYHDLLPIPFTEEALRHIAARIHYVQDFLGQRILVENVSSYLTFESSTSEEADFVADLLELADCDLLLDINNVYVNSVNHGIDARAYLRRIPAERVREIHLAGYEEREGYLLDAHNRPVTSPVWALYEEFLTFCPGIPTLIEWDKDIPSFERLRAEARRADEILARAGVDSRAGMPT